MSARATVTVEAFASMASVCVPRPTLVMLVKSNHGVRLTATAMECVKKNSVCASLALLESSVRTVCLVPMRVRSMACVTTTCVCATMAGRALTAHNLSVARAIALDMEIAREMPACVTVALDWPIAQSSSPVPWTACMGYALALTVCVTWVLLAPPAQPNPLAVSRMDVAAAVSVMVESSVCATKIIMGTTARKSWCALTNAPIMVTASGACVCAIRAGMEMIAAQSPTLTIALPRDQP